MVVLDTCALIELGKTDSVLPKKTLHRIEQGAFLLSISFAEIACKVKIGKLEMKLKVHDLYQAFSAIKNINIVNIGVDEWLDSIALDWPENKDPADRVILAFAKKRKLPIITSDAQIAKFYDKVLWK